MQNRLVAFYQCRYPTLGLRGIKKRFRERGKIEFSAQRREKCQGLERERFKKSKGVVGNPEKV